MTIDPRHVYCVHVPGADYQTCRQACVPELNLEGQVNNVLLAMRSLLQHAGLDANRFDSRDWNPLAECITSDSKVVIKPNWVYHAHPTGLGTDCLLTHPRVLEAITHYVLKARPRSIIIGDAPVQACHFDQLNSVCGLNELLAIKPADHPTEMAIRDFRRTVVSTPRLGEMAQQDRRPVVDYVLFDLGTESLLEPITTDRNDFRVVMYNPDLLAARHCRGRHQYLIARELIEADVVINAPKLKTHKKSGITGALKNLIGINGNKEFLPHHRKGCPRTGGDCYKDYSWIKARVEDLFDAIYRTQNPSARALYTKAARVMSGVGKLMKVDPDYEGSWFGNDTVWRTCLDLQRILRYGRLDGTLDRQPQRQVISITDAVIAGEGDGPIHPEPVNLGLLTLASCTAAAEWVHALLMGMDPGRIPLTREAFGTFNYPLASFRPAEIAVDCNGMPIKLHEVFTHAGRSFRPPRGWQGYCERRGL